MQLQPDIADEVVWSDSLTAYDQEHLAVYLRLLDADQAGADWREAARLVLGRCAEDDPGAARACWESHLRRARWMTEVGYRLLLLEGRAED
ncbi:DNA -binding domain-containing protein [Caulobacter zeae]|uniref:DNA -binding domain-containing protein n=1 Tax=Caulobacter zeae TaxID=2055137 RepID=UPI001F0CCD96|nr:DUF2285 domain-containing protein [Caulobacter zeae]